MCSKNRLLKNFLLVIVISSFSVFFGCKKETGPSLEDFTTKINKCVNQTLDFDVKEKVGVLKDFDHRKNAFKKVLEECFPKVTGVKKPFVKMKIEAEIGQLKHDLEKIEKEFDKKHKIMLARWKDRVYRQKKGLIKEQTKDEYEKWQADCYERCKHVCAHKHCNGVITDECINRMHSKLVTCSTECFETDCQEY